MYGHTYSKSKDQSGKVVSPARISWTGKNVTSLPAFVHENLVLRDGFGSPVPRQPAHLHTRAESGSYLRDSYRVPRRHPYIYFKPPYAIGSDPSLSGHAIPYRWRSLPRVRRHRASKLQGSFTNGCRLARSFSHTHYCRRYGFLYIVIAQHWATGGCSPSNTYKRCAL